MEWVRKRVDDKTLSMCNRIWGQKCTRAPAHAHTRARELHERLMRSTTTELSRLIDTLLIEGNYIPHGKRNNRVTALLLPSTLTGARASVRHDVRDVLPATHITYVRSADGEPRAAVKQLREQWAADRVRTLRVHEQVLQRRSRVRLGDTTEQGEWNHMSTQIAHRRTLRVCKTAIQL